MSSSRNSGPARTPAFLLTLIGSLVVLLVMWLHPTGAESIADANAHGAGAGAVLWRGRIVHGAAIGAVPLLLVGMGALSWRLRARPWLSGAALTCFLLAAVSVMAAAIMSGLVAPAMLGDLAEASDVVRDAARRELALQQLHYTGRLNQAFATVYMALTAVAMTLWGLAMRGQAGFAPLVRWLAPLAGLGPWLLVLVGHLHLDVTGFAVVIVCHTVWMTMAAWSLSRGESSDQAAGTTDGEAARRSG
ncbi:MAG: hypothetical protein K2Y26_19730 [Gemmatimonadaceae bacterium]|nr:hypothetical protein [Gemmatimonadaceae bacterium]